MNYEEFKQRIENDLKDALEAKGYGKVEVAFEQTNKVNQSYEAIVVKPEGGTIGASLKVESIFEHYNITGDYDAALSKAANTFAEAIDNMPKYGTQELSSYEKMKDKLAIEVIPADRNENLLQRIPHKLMEDMAIVYRIILDRTEDGTNTILVTNNLINQMGVTPEQLHQDALENAQKIRPAELNTLRDTLVELVGPEMVSFMDEDGPESKIFVATVDDKMHGAGVIAYQEFMNEVSEKVGGDFYIIPASVHEVLIVPDLPNMDIKSMEDMIHTVNATELRPEDILSEKLYHYDSKEKVFEMADKFEARQKAKVSVLGDLKAKREEMAKVPNKDEILKAPKKDKSEQVI